MPDVPHDNFRLGHNVARESLARLGVTHVLRFSQSDSRGWRTVAVLDDVVVTRPPGVTARMVEEQAGAFDPEPAPKFCKDCKWMMANTVTPSVLINSLCGHSSAVKPTNLVTGETPHNQFCEARRINGCGPEGKNWEAK